MARLFIAFHIPASDDLRNVLRELSTIGGRVRAVDPDQLHLTLRFLGETLAEDTGAITAAMRTAVRHTVKTGNQADCPFSVTWQGVGQFPPLRTDGSAPSPRVVFARPDEHAAAALTDLAAALDDALLRCLPHLPPEKRGFHPHLTLARIKPPRRPRPSKRSRRNASPAPVPTSTDPPRATPPDDLQPVRDLLHTHAEAALGTSCFDRLNLIESTLTPQGPVYTTRASIPLYEKDEHLPA